MLVGSLCCLLWHVHVVFSLDVSVCMQLFQNWLKPQVVLLDVGMATELTGDDRNNMLALFQGFSELDGAAMAEATLKFAGKAQRCLNPEGFRNAIAECASVLCAHCSHALSSFEEGTQISPI